MGELYLEHHGIKGQKWGVRRFQNADGTLTLLGKRRAANNYSYKDSDLYKNGTRADKVKQSNEYEKIRMKYNEKYANRTLYRMNEQGMSVKEAEKKLKGEKVVKDALSIIGSQTLLTLVNSDGSIVKFGRPIVNKYVNSIKTKIDINNAAVNSYAKANGIPIVDGGYGLGIKAAHVGSKIIDEYQRRK